MYPLVTCIIVVIYRGQKRGEFLTRGALTIELINFIFISNYHSVLPFFLFFSFSLFGARLNYMPTAQKIQASYRKYYLQADNLKFWHVIQVYRYSFALYIRTLQKIPYVYCKITHSDQKNSINNQLQFYIWTAFY